MNRFVSISNPEDVKAILLSPSFKSVPLGDLYKDLRKSSGMNFDALLEYIDHSIFFSEGKLHNRLKRTAVAASKVQSARNLLDFKRIAKAVVTDIPAGTEANLAECFSMEIVNRILAELLGLSRSELKNYEAWRDTLDWILAVLPPWKRVKQFDSAAQNFHQQLLQWYAKDNGRHLESSCLHGLTGELDEDETAYVAGAILLGGIATSYTLNKALILLLSDTQMFEVWRGAFKDDYRLAARKIVSVASAVSEVIRICTSPETIGGETLNSGDRVRLQLTNNGADSLCPAGAVEKHIGFGFGRHKCPGEALAYEIIAVSLNEFFDVFSGAEFDPNKVVYETGHPLQKVTSLPAILKTKMTAEVRP